MFEAIHPKTLINSTSPNKILRLSTTLFSNTNFIREPSVGVGRGQSKCSFLYGSGGKDRIAERWVGSLHGQVPDQSGVGLDAETFLVVVGGVQELDWQVRPYRPYCCWREPGHVGFHRTTHEHASRVFVLQKKSSQMTFWTELWFKKYKDRPRQEIFHYFLKIRTIGCEKSNAKTRY